MKTKTLIDVLKLVKYVVTFFLGYLSGDVF